MTTSNRRGQRRAIVLDQLDLVESGYLADRPDATPAVLRPTRPDVDLPAWAASNTELIESLLAKHGAVLFRGFAIDSPTAFSGAAAAIVGQLFGDYGDLPREQDAEKVFSSTPYPADLPIHFHNESSHMAQWPMRIFFHCVTAAETGGETPLLDCRALVNELDRSVVQSFEDKGLTYIRNFGKGIDVAWQDFFGTDDPTEVNRRCAAAGTSAEWLDDDRLRIRQDAAGVRRHPRSGEACFFNQVLLHHPAALPADTRAAMTELYDDESFPRSVVYGDGSKIPDETIEYLLAEYDKRAIRFPWGAGDMIMLDNMLVSHGRAPFTGARKILVAMAEIQQAG
jgi:alpha-ketoglutarate-dependent taurine dioxygenase